MEVLMALTQAQQDKQWQAESDARSLRDSEIIKKDPARFKAAKAEVLKQIIQKEAELKAFKNLANIKTKEI